MINFLFRVYSAVFYVFFIGCISLIPLQLNGRDFEYDDLIYTVLDETSKTVETKAGDNWQCGNSVSGYVNIPAEVSDGEYIYSVVRLGEYSFSFCKELARVDIPESVKEIGKSCFSGCEKLWCTNIPKDIIKIEEFTFYGCKQLSELSLPDSLQEIGPSAFKRSGISSLNFTNNQAKLICIGEEAFSGSKICSVELPNSIKCIGKYAFDGCNGINSITLPNSVDSIGDYAFSNCTGMKALTLQDSDNLSKKEVRIGSYAFNGCTSLRDVKISNDLRKISPCLFYRCKALESIDISGSVTEIESSAFWECSNLQSIKFHAGLSKIGGAAFSDCVSLDNVLLPDSLSEVPSKCFYNCSSLSNVFIPASVKTIGENAFRGTSDSLVVDIDERNRSFCSDGGFIYNKEKTKLIFCPDYVKDYTTPNTIVEIAPYAFEGNQSIRSVKFTESVKEIGRGAFDSCFLLETVEFSDSLKIIQRDAFENCKVLKTVVIPSAVDTLGLGAFRYCDALETLTITGCRTILKDYCFYMCKNLKNLYVYSKTPLFCESVYSGYSSSALAYCGQSTTEWESSTNVYVPEESIETYKRTPGWNVFKNFYALNIPATDVKIREDSLTMHVGEDLLLEAIVFPSYATDKLYWNSDNENVVAVDSIGEVRAVSLGNAIVTVDCGDFSARCKVSVIPTLASSIELNSTELSLKVGERSSMIATVLPETTTDKTVDWSVENESIASISEEGEVCALEIGQTFIYAQCGVVKETCVLNVIETMASSVELEYSELSLKIGESFILNASVWPETTTDKTLIWESSDSSIVSVSEAGLISSHRVGTAYITVRCGEVSAQCVVNVLPILASEVDINCTELTLNVGESSTLSATVQPEDTTDKTIIWESSNEYVASVSSDGEVSALRVGETILSASCGNAVAYCKVTVTPVLASALYLDQTIIHSTPGEVYQLNATIEPDNVTSKILEWRCTNPSIATVDSQGIVAILEEGECTIIVRTKDGSNLSTECRILSTADVESLRYDSTRTFDIYTIQGNLLHTSVNINILKSLLSGVYIVHYGEKIEKILIK